MIRRMQSDEMDELIDIWLASTIQAHPFIRERYWHESESIVRNVYIPQSMTWVYVENDKIVGFISVLDSHFIGALFVSEPFIGKGIGQALMAHVKTHFSALSLEVYQMNHRAVHFYHHQGFRIEESAWQNETHHPTWIMSWQEGETL